MSEDKTPIRPITDRCNLVSCGIVCLSGGRSRTLYRCDACKRDGAFWPGHPPQCLDKAPPQTFAPTDRSLT